MAEPIEMPFGIGLGWLQGRSMYQVWCTVAPPGEYHSTVHVRRRSGLLTNNFDNMFFVRYTQTVYSDPLTSSSLETTRHRGVQALAYISRSGYVVIAMKPCTDCKSAQ